MKVIFLGTPEFSVKILDSILSSRHKVVGIVTQPDKINARGNKIIFGKVKEYAIKNRLPVFQYDNINKQGVEQLRSLNADIMVTAAYGQILKQNILDLCPKGIINVHASLLPEYRGSSPVQWALINGENKVGITVMQTEIGVDTGDMILQEAIQLEGSENSQEVLELLSNLGSKLIINALDLIEKNEVVFIPQDESKATHCRILVKEDGIINWKNDCKDIKNLIRGIMPWPSAFTTCKFGRLKILKAEISDNKNFGTPGEILLADPKIGFTVKCGKGALDLLIVQGENAKAMDASSYLLGKRLEKGDILGE